MNPWLDFPYASQVFGAVCGGAVGGFAGFIANSFLGRQASMNARRSVAAALAGEISALLRQMDLYESVLRADLDDVVAGRHAYHRFRAERDYMPVFHSLGADIGRLPMPLPTDLVYWYAQMSLVLELARELHELLCASDPAVRARAIYVAEMQRDMLVAQKDDAAALLEKLACVSEVRRARRPAAGSP